MIRNNYASTNGYVYDFRYDGIVSEANVLQEDYYPVCILVVLKND